MDLDLAPNPDRGTVPGFIIADLPVLPAIKPGYDIDFKKSRLPSPLQVSALCCCTQRARSVIDLIKKSV